MAATPPLSPDESPDDFLSGVPVLTYSEDLLLEMVERSQDWVTWPWESDQEGEYKLELTFLTYLNTATTSNLARETQGPDLTPGATPGRGVSFATKLEEAYRVDPDLLDYSKTLGRTIVRSRQRGVHFPLTSVKEEVFACSCDNRTCSGKPFKLFLVEDDSPLQYLPALSVLEACVRNWIPSLDWLHPAEWESGEEREQACRAVLLGFHLWVLRRYAEDVRHYLSGTYRDELRKLAALVEDFVGRLQLLSRLEGMEEGAVNAMIADPSHRLHKMLVQRTGSQLNHWLAGTRDRREAMAVQVSEAATLVDAICKILKNLVCMVVAAHDDLTELRTLLATAPSTRVCQERMDQVQGQLYEMASSIHHLRQLLLSDIAWLTHSQELRIASEDVPTGFLVIEQSIMDGKTFLQGINNALEQLRQWDQVFNDIRKAYRAPAAQESIGANE